MGVACLRCVGWCEVRVACLLLLASEQSERDITGVTNGNWIYIWYMQDTSVARAGGT